MALLLGMLPTGGGAGAQPAPPEGSTPPTGVADSGYLPSVADLEPPSALTERAISVLGDQFVDVAISDDYATYLVGVVGVEPDHFADIETALTSRAPVRLVARPTPLARLERVREVVEATVRFGAESVTSTGLDKANGKVLVGVTSSEAAAAVSHDLDGAGLPEEDLALVSVQIEKPGTNEESNSSFPPHRGGKRIGVGGGAYNCTTGFTIQNDFGYFGLTAGHCGGVGQGVWLGGFRRDEIRNNTYYSQNPSNADAAAHLLGSGQQSKTIYIDSDTNRTVSGQLGEADMVDNLRVRMRGSVTAIQRCGDLDGTYLDRTLTFDDDGRTARNLYCTETYFSQDGDSGGPWYRVQADGTVKALGLHKGRYDSRSCFTQISPALTALGSQLYK